MSFVEHQNSRQYCRAAMLVLLGFVLCASLQAGTLTVSSTTTGSTPNLIGYNLAHFYTGGNTPVWFRYSGVTGARIFISPGALGEGYGNDQISPWGDGVTDQTSFLARKSSLRASQLVVGTTGSGPYINWDGSSSFKGFNYLYTQNIGSGSGTVSNQIVPVEAFSQLRSMNIDVLVNITASPNSFPINDTSSTQDWGGRWELWLHYYAQAFYLGKNYGVSRYQIYNEPDNSSNGLPSNINFTDESEYLLRLSFATDAIQSAIADVNTEYGTSLVPNVLAPVTTHGDSDYFGTGIGSYTDWGHSVVNNRHINFLGQSASNYWLVNQYDFHTYGSTPSNYDGTINLLEGYIAADMPGETPFAVSVSEFNTHTGANFANLTTTLDSPTEYSTFGSIGVHLLNSTPAAFYCFKFGQTYSSGSSESDPTDTVAKNGMHYVDNWNKPYDTGGITKAGEVWRLINKGFAPGRQLLAVTLPSDGSLNAVDIAASYDPVLQRYYLLCSNDSSSSVSMTVNTGAWNLPVGNTFLLEEVSESLYGSPRTWGTVGSGNILLNGTNSTFVQPANTVWLFTLPTAIQQPEQDITASDDATVKDGTGSTNANVNFGSDTTLTVSNTSSSTPNGRNATLLKFQLPSNIRVSDIQLAVLSVTGAITPGKTTGQAHVYGLPNTSSSWSEASVTWNNAPNLDPNAPGGLSISDNFVLGGNASLTSGSAVMMCGQILATSSSQTEYFVDVTNMLRAQTINDHVASFLIAREVRYYGDAIDTDGITFVSKEGSLSACPRLKLIYKSDTSLSALTSSVGTLNPGFNPAVASYTATVPYATSTVTVSATCFDPTCTLQVRINGGTYSTLTSGGTSAPLSLNIGANPIDMKVTAQDGVTTTTYTLTVTRTPLDTPPTISNIDDQTINPNSTTGALAFTVGDAETAPGLLTVSGSSSNSALVPNSNIVFGGSGANRTVTITPAANQSGSATITISVNDGIIITSETFALTVNATQQTVTVLTDATVESGSYATTDISEATDGCVRTKFDSNLNFARKAYFQFDVSSLNVNTSGTATFTLNFTNNYQQNVQLWALNQSYLGFSSVLTWNTAQANSLGDNSMNVTATQATPFTATAIGSPVVIPTSGTNPYTFSIPNIGNYVQGGRITFVLTSVASSSNNSGGLRVGIGGSTGTAAPTLVVPLNSPPTITNIADQTISQNSTTGALVITVGDIQTPSASLTVSGSSSNTTLVPVGNITLAGSGASRTVTITPAANQSGTANITLSVNDGTLTTSTSFLLTVDPPWTTWQKAQFGVNWNNPAIAGDSADPDQDGISNLYEYALGGNPNLASQSILPQTSLPGGKLALTFTRTLANTDITMTVQASDSMTGSWTNLASSSSGAAFAALTGGVTVTETGSGATRSVQVSDLYLISNPAHPHRFMRLLVTRP